MISPGGNNKPIFFLTFCERTAFFKLEDIFPECFFHRKNNYTEPMYCMTGDCPVNHNCMEALSKRVFVLFQEILPQAKLMVLYYRKRNTPSSIGGTLFWRDMSEPRNITINPYGWARIKQRGNVYQFHPPTSFFITGRAATPEETQAVENLALD